MTRKTGSHAASRLLSWSALETALGSVLSILSVLITAWLLSPAELGQATLAISIVTIVQLAGALGLAEAFAQQRSSHTAVQHSLFWFALGMGLLTTLACVSIGVLLATRLASGPLGDMVAVYGTICLLQGVSVVPQGVLTRKMRAQKLLAVSLAARTTLVATTTVAALLGWSSWSIIIGALAGASTNAAMMWRLHARMPRLHFAWHDITPLLRFGALLGLEGLLWTLTTRAFLLLTGSIHGVTTVGLFGLALRLTEELSTLFSSTAGRYALPFLAKVRRDRGHTARAFLKGSSLATCFFVPLFVGATVLADELFAVLFAPQWRGAVPAFQVLALLSAIAVSRILVPVYLRVIGKQSVNLLITLVTMVLSLSGVILAPKGQVVFVALAYASRVILAFPISLYVLAKVGSVRIPDQLKLFMAPVAASVVMVIMVSATKTWLAAMPGLVGLTASALTGALTYMLVLWCLDRSSFHFALKLLPHRTRVTP